MPSNLSSRALTLALLPEHTRTTKRVEGLNVPLTVSPGDQDEMKLTILELIEMIDRAREVGKREGQGTLDDAHLRSIGLIPIRNIKLVD